MLNFEEKTICECCECNPDNGPRSEPETCKHPLNSCILRYCNFDKVQQKGIASVDCIRISSNNKLVLLEIKNQRASNIEPEVLKNKIIETTRYLKSHEETLFHMDKLFVLSISEYKQLSTYSTFNHDFLNIKNSIFSYYLSEFNKEYSYCIGNENYCIDSKICFCHETDELCK